MQFESYWLSNYSGSAPLSHLFKYYFRNRWFRIMNFPENKKFTITKQDWEGLLKQQNEIITDLIGNSSKLLGITGEYGSVDNFEKPSFISKGLLSKFSFVELNPIDLYSISNTEFKMGEIYKSYISTYKVCLTTHNNSGCVSSSCQDVFVGFTKIVAVPSGFTPNKDDINDFLKVKGGPLLQMHFQIFNEWGNLLFTSTSQDNGWDGTFNGDPQPAGVYEYILNAISSDNKTISLYGAVNLIR